MLIPHLLLMGLPLRRVAAGEKLIAEGTEGKEVYVLSEGEVRVDIGGQQIIFLSERGTIFGEMAALLGRPRGATVTVVRDAAFFVIDDLLAFLKTDAELALELLKLLAQRIDEMNALATERRKWWQVF